MNLVNQDFMVRFFARTWYWVICLGVVGSAIAMLELPATAQRKIYDPVPLSSDNEIADTLSERDIPTGEGGFARDYFMQLEEGDQIAIDLTSEEFDTIVTLISSDGSTIAENDDGPDGTTNSLLFSRITENGKYIIRVRAFGETSGGKFQLKLTRLKPAGE